MIEARLLAEIPAGESPNGVVWDPFSGLLTFGTEGRGVMWCDGRRSTELPPGARVDVVLGERPVRLARLSAGSFTDRLVEKFHLPVQGWRGNGAGR